MFNNNNDCIYKALSNTVLFEDKKDQQKQPSSNNHKNQEKQNWLWKAPHSRPAAGQAGKEEETAPNSFSSLQGQCPEIGEQGKEHRGAKERYETI